MISNPFLTLSGYTTPTTFNDLVSYAQATNGFIGRSIIFEEKDNNPKSKRGFKKGGISLHLEHELRKLQNGGHANCNTERIELIGDKEVITTNDAAIELLDKIESELHSFAAHAMETNGLEAIARRSFELVLKVSMILAIGDGKVRTVPHVRWAYALIKKDLTNKINLTGANMAQEEKNAVNEILSKVKHKLDVDQGITLGAVANKLRSLARENIEKALDHLVNTGEARTEDIKKKTGPVSKVYFAV